MSDETVVIDIDEVLHEIAEAYRVRIGDKQHWLPKSQTRLFPDEKGIELPEWLAEKRGFI